MDLEKKKKKNVSVNVKKSIRNSASEKDYAWNRRRWSCECDKDSEVGEYTIDYWCMESFVDDLWVTCDEI